MSLHAKLTALLLALSALAMVSCLTDRAARTAQVETVEAVDGFSYVMNRDWVLSEIRTALETVTLDRYELAERFFGSIFTMRFDGNLVSGTAVPNTYRGPYALADGQAITIGPLGTTRMATSVQPDELTEHGFINYMYNAFMWDLAEGNLELELHTTAADGTETVLVFVLLQAGE